jgi:spoIIIJ-associated protein
MRSIEAEGTSIDDAIANALKELQVERDRVEVEILSDATRGLFGLGGKKARVRATMRAPVGSGPERRERERDREPSERREHAPRERRRPPEPQPPVFRDERGERDQIAGDDAGFAEPDHAESRATNRPVSREALGCATDMLREVLQLMGIEATVTEEPGAVPEDIVLQVDGEASGVVIGRHGQGLDAIEYILNRMVARQFNDSGHIVVDAASYRARRRQNLVEMARRMADKAKRERRTVTINPLSPRDRRIVHLTLQEDREVTTRSHGDGLHRKLLIIPQGSGRRHGGGARSR